MSVCIPVRNEERNLPACIAALGDAFDDIVVVDSRSTDGTAAVAAAHGARVVPFDWDGRFPKKRTWALRHVPFVHDWVLFLDADEFVTPAFVAELCREIPSTRHVGFLLSFANHFMGRPLRHGDRFRKVALFRRDAGEYEEFPEDAWTNLDMEVHEHPVLRGTIGAIHSPIDHREDRGLHHYIAKHNEYSTWEANRFRWLRAAPPAAWRQLTARQRFKYRNLDRWWLAKLYYWTSLVAKCGVLDGPAGWRFAALKRRYFEDIRLKILEADARDRRS